MILLKAILYVKFSFLITLLFAVLVGDIFTIWYDNNMLEEFLIIVSIVFIYAAVTKKLHYSENGE